jgi:HD superfamily phosphohydrolase YqeK
MNETQILLDRFITSISMINGVVVHEKKESKVAPQVHVAIKTAKKLLPLLNDHATKSRVACLLHDLYKELRTDIKIRGAVVNGQKNPAQKLSLEAYRIIIS